MLPWAWCIIPLCQGLPDRPCPKRRNDGSVKLGEGDLMFCCECDEERFKNFCGLHGKYVNVKSMSDNVTSG